MKNRFLHLLMVCFCLASCGKANDTSPDTSTTKADFTIATTNAYLNAPVKFDINNPANVSCIFDFGDGSSGTTAGNSISHSFSKAGTYTILLKTSNTSVFKKIRIYPGTCSFQIKNSFNPIFKYPGITFYEAGTHDGLNATITLPNLINGVISDTVFVNLPVQYSYDPPMGLSLTYTNAYQTDIYFTTYNFTPKKGTHLIFEIKGSTTGDYSYRVTPTYFQDGFGALSTTTVFH